MKTIYIVLALVCIVALNIFYPKVDAQREAVYETKYPNVCFDINNDPFPCE